ncbi:hypothetical protein D3C81_1793150 [compost metagenome]
MGKTEILETEVTVSGMVLPPSSIPISTLLRGDSILNREEPALKWASPGFTSMPTAVSSTILTAKPDKSAIAIAEASTNLEASISS